MLTIKKAAFIMTLFVIAASFMSCAAIEKQDSMDTERLLAASGFKMKLAATPEKMTALQALPQRKLVPQEHEGKNYFYYADAEFCKCLYVGTEQSYQKFQTLAEERKVAQDYRWAAEASLDTSMSFGMWGPWGPWGPWY